MSTLVARGTFATTTGIAGTTVAVTGLGFSPDGIILFYGGRVTNNTNAKGTPRRGIGFVARNGAGVDNVGAGTYDTDGGATSDTGGWDSSSRSVKRLTTGLVNGGEGHVSSLDADGFTFTVDIAFGSSLSIEFLAIGGSDVVGIGIGNFQLPTSTGNFAVTGVGGKPDAVFLVGVRNTGTDAAYHDFSLSFGAATRFNGGQGVWAGGADHGGATSATLSVGARGAIYQLFNSTVTGNQSRGSFVSFDSDGFTLNALQGTVADRFYYLAITGPAFKLGGISIATDTTTTTKEDNLGLIPKGFLFVGHEGSESTTTSPTGDDMWSMAAATTASDRNVMGTESFTGATGGDVVQGTYDGIFLDLADTPAVEIQTDLTAVGRNSFSYKNVTNTTAGNGFAWYVAIGDAPTAVIDTSRGDVQSAGTPGATGAVLDTSRGDFRVTGTPGATGAVLDTSRGDDVSAGAPGIGGAPLATTRGDTAAAGGDGEGGSILDTSRGDFQVTGTVGISGVPLSTSRGDDQAAGAPGIGSTTLITSRGDFQAAASEGVGGAVLVTSRGDDVAAGTPGIGGAPRISERGDFFTSSGNALSADIFLTSRGDLQVTASEGATGAVLDTSRGDFVVTGTIDTQDAFACRPGNIRWSIVHRYTKSPWPQVKFRGNRR